MSKNCLKSAALFAIIKHMKTNSAKFSILIAVFAAAICLFGVAANLPAKAATSSIPYESFYSKTNEPIFYGATKITIDTNVVTTFSILDSRFRIFAKDFEDGDLTSKIVCESNNVDPTQAGSYQIKYSVVDSHKNKAKITVPVEVQNKAEGECIIERTVYAIPKMQNMTMVGTERCNNGDRQILGVFVPQNASIQIKPIDIPKDMTLTFFTNTRAQNSIQKITFSNKQYQTFTNTKNNTSYAAVPLITSTRLDQEKINQTYKIELKFGPDVKPLDYYHHNDNQATFNQNWKESQNEFGVVDGEAILCVVPFADVDKLSNYVASGYNNPFESIDAFLEYYKEVVDRMDAMIGLQFDAKMATNQNYRTKYTCVADAGMSGVGAYYNGDFIAVCSTSIAPVFQYGWGTLHEIAHGYQGNLGRGANSNSSIYLNETGNNILAHYIQMDSSLYKKSDRYLGKLTDAEESANQSRYSKIANGQNIFNNNSGTYTNITEKMYCIINLLDAFEGSSTYGKLFQYYRNLVQKYGVNKYSIPDIYAMFFASEYNVNIVPYLKQWTMQIDQNVESSILNLGLESFSVAADNISQTQMQEIIQNENLELKYGLVSDKIVQKYEIKSNLKINLKIDDFSKIKNKNIALFYQNKLIKIEKITQNSILFENIPTGYYEIKLPIDYEFENNICSAILKEGDNEIDYNFNYRKITDYASHPTEIRINGIWGTVGYKLSFENNYKLGKVTLGGADLGNRNTTWENQPDQVFCSVSIKNSQNQVVDLLEVKGNQYFSDLELSNPTLSFEIGYKIAIYTQKPNLVGVYSATTGQKIDDYNTTNSNIEYEITQNGLKLLNADNFDEAQVLYNAYREELIKIIEDYINSATEAEISNKRINPWQKVDVIDAYNSLNQIDKQNYDEFIKKIIRGSSPIIYKNTEKIKVKQYQKINLFDYITIFDTEDLDIESNDQNVSIQTNLNTKIAGEYFAIFSATDFDGNTTKCKIAIEVEKANPTQPKSASVLIIVCICVAVAIVLCAVVIVVFKSKKRKSNF